MAPQPSKDTPAVQARRREHRDRIVIAAVGLFARRGFHRTSMQQIADELGMSVGSLYQYFRNKDAIIVEATRVKDRTSAASLGQVGDAAGLAHLLRDTLRQIAAGPAETAALNCEIVAESARNPVVAERLNDQFDGARAMLADALRATHPGLSEAEAGARAELYIAVQIGIGALRATGAPIDDLAALGDRALPAIVPPPEPAPPSA